MSSMPLISAIIPTYKREDVLNKSIETVIKQTYKGDIEIIIVDDSPAYNTHLENIKTPINRKIRYIYNGKPQGSPYARNIGIQQSKGEYVAFLDDDDRWLPEKTSKQLELMKKYKRCPLVICYSHDMRFGQDRIQKPPEVISHKTIIKSFNLSSTSSYFVRSRWLNIMCKDKEYFDISLPSAQEYDLAIRLSMFDDVRCVPEVLIEQFACSGQISENWNRKIKGIKAIAKKYKHEYTIKDKVKTFGIVNLFRIAKIPGVGNKIYKIIIPIKKVYENTGERA